MLLSFLPIYSAPLASPLSRHSYALSISSVARCSAGCLFHISPPKNGRYSGQHGVPICSTPGWLTRFTHRESKNYHGQDGNCAGNIGRGYW